MIKLTTKEETFVKEYVTNGYVGIDAYLTAYDSTNRQTATNEASKLLKKDKIQKAIEAEEGGYKQLARRNSLSKEQIVKKLGDLIFGTTTVVTKTGNIVEIPNDGKTINAAINTLCKLTGDFAPEKSIVSINEESDDRDLTQMTEEQLIELKAQLLKDL